MHAECFYVQNVETNEVFSAGSNQEGCLSNDANNEINVLTLIKLEDELEKGEKFVHFNSGCRHV